MDGETRNPFDFSLSWHNPVDWQQHEWEAKPIPSPVRIADFQLRADLRPEEAESSVQMSWKSPNVGGMARVYRLITPLMKRSATSGFQTIVVPHPDTLPQVGWTVINTSENEGFGSFRHYIDQDVPSVDEAVPSRHLGAAYSYRVEVSGGEREARSPVLTTTLRGINSPRIMSIRGLSDSEIGVEWRNNSKYASGFEVRYFEKETGQNKNVVQVNGAAVQRLTIGGLSPDTAYVVTVKAWDYYGKSAGDHAEASTNPASETEPEDKTFNVQMRRQEVVEGPVPYLGRFPTAGNLPSGTLRGVSLHSAWPALGLVKPGRSTNECADPDAVVRLQPGEALSDSEMAELYGAERPNLPVSFLACADFTSTLYEFIPLHITYRTD